MPSPWGVFGAAGPVGPPGPQGPAGPGGGTVLGSGSSNKPGFGTVALGPFTRSANGRIAVFWFNTSIGSGFLDDMYWQQKNPGIGPNDFLVVFASADPANDYNFDYIVMEFTP